MATTDKRVSVTELDFDDIKTNLKTFMRNQMSLLIMTLKVLVSMHC